jgi:hypothetical protein
MWTEKKENLALKHLMPFPLEFTGDSAGLATTNTCTRQRMFSMLLVSEDAMAFVQQHLTNL